MNQKNPDSLKYLEKKQAILIKRVAIAQQRVKSNPTSVNIATASQVQFALHQVQHKIKSLSK